MLPLNQQALILTPFSDSPIALATSALQAIPALAGTQETGFAWSLYTGDIVSHDPENQLSRQVSLIACSFYHSFYTSRDFVLYTEV
jgi:hypothetical protein